ncbi:four helix bundle protein [Flavivirga eckloniae]|uniref:Diversity-generating retroelement protein bAvd family protein n=1 Tax=Flavivirga eckloniae TaxID=1803846 RepID=A0A2K9PTL6_9FLAO|nr:four helix bundle protein [Flavivirga eckloniae]AUP80403.1 diversity-generating retroelement protein bAvd family protein [Flavivirga eckloniae]
MDFKQLIAYKKAFDLSMDIFNISKAFPKEETYSLTDQIRRSSRLVCANIAEAYRKRRYPKHFTSKLTDADGENSETNTWLDFALACQYISSEDHLRCAEQGKEIGKLINYMINNSSKFGVKLE